MEGRDCLRGDILLSDEIFAEAMIDNMYPIRDTTHNTERRAFTHYHYV